jgi:hypothetical protein
MLTHGCNIFKIGLNGFVIAHAMAEKLLQGAGFFFWSAFSKLEHVLAL